jgi:uncharacterized BrkB/YihY/UPF0761 family membrane protein
MPLVSAAAEFAGEPTHGYYSAQIFLFGAELTKALAEERTAGNRRDEMNLRK